MWLVGSAVAFLIFSMGELDLEFVGLLMVTLLMHELGHLLAMWIFGYRNLKIFFIPFLGAAAVGKGRGVAPWKEAVVLLAGPVPGILLGYVLLFGVAVSGHQVVPEWQSTLVGTLILLNGFNLLPFVPLDGGRLVSLALFTHSPSIETWFSVVSAGALVLGMLLLSEWVLAAFGAFWVWGALGRAHLVERAHALRRELAGAPLEPADLSDEQQHVLYRAAVDLVAGGIKPGAAQPPTQQVVQALGVQMRLLHERVTTPTVSGATSIMLCGLYLLALLSLVPMAYLMLLDGQ